jgi:transposase
MLGHMQQVFLGTTFHTLPKEVRADRRKQAFKLLDKGHTKYEVAEFSEVHFKTVEDWKKYRERYEENNYHGLKRGNPNDRKLLNEKQQEEVLTAIKDSTPDKEGIESFLWSRKAIREFIQKKYTLEVSFQIISLYTKRWGLSSQRPKKQASEQDPEKMRTWLKETYPKIQKRAKKEGATIHWADETNLNINTNYQKTYAPKGSTPIAKIPARKTSYSMVSSLTNQGKLRYMVYKGGMNAILFRTFLKRLTKDTDTKIFLILDNLKVHHAKIIQAWQKEHSDKIEIFFPTSIRSTIQS